MMRTAIALLVLSLAASAQNPAPAGEGKAVWTAQESQVYAYVQRVASAWRDGRDCESWRRSHQMDLPGYTIARVDWRDGEPQLSNSWGTRRSRSPGRCLVYVAPSKNGSQSRRAFCVRGDGIAAFTNNSQDLSMIGEDRFEPDAVLGAGGDGDLKEFPRMPARGRDGNLWQPTAMLRPITISVMVVDDAGEPMAMRSLMCVQAAPDHAIPHPLPAGTLLTTIEGNTKLAGMPARGLGFALNNGSGRRFWIPQENVTVRGRAVRITVSRALLHRQRMNANESAAIATLKNVSSAQSQCQASGVIDVNKNGQGEYGTFAEMSGRHKIRGSNLSITPPVLSAAFGNVQGGMVARSGYYFRMFLPGKNAEPMPESARGGLDVKVVDAANAERQWCCYAWPIEAGESGTRTFFIDQSGDVLAMDNSDGLYSGAGKPPAGNAARKGAGGMAAAVAANNVGVDKQSWKVIQ